ncbi:hypothetical protein [Paraburkholderia xenovorans]|uniref:hypothetical protein n=1 Tax=Paraburkholderia xenovorans TaxID=36873 RepID=UPI0038BDEB43
MTNSSLTCATIDVDAGICPHAASDLAHLGERILKPRLRATLAALAMSLALSGCGVFRGGAGGSGGGFAGGWATGMRF